MEFLRYLSIISLFLTYVRCLQYKHTYHSLSMYSLSCDFIYIGLCLSSSLMVLYLILTHNKYNYTYYHYMGILGSIFATFIKVNYSKFLHFLGVKFMIFSSFMFIYHIYVSYLLLLGFTMFVLLSFITNNFYIKNLTLILEVFVILLCIVWF